MQRRHFIRLAGGGTLAAAAALAGCGADSFPAEALAPWQGPAEGTELRRWAVSWAILAPSSHNLQPWLVDLSEPQAITLRVDRQRLLPETDPWFRQIMVSQGTFTEALVLALRQRGIEAQVDLFPEGEPAPRQLDDRPVARLSWHSNQTTAQPDPLFAYLPRRRTSKVAFDTERPVTPEALSALVSATQAGDVVQAGATVQPTRVQALRSLCLQAAEVEVGTPRTALETLRLTRVGPSEIAQHRDGVSLNALLPRIASAVGLFDRSQAPQRGSTAFDQTMAHYRATAGTAMGFVWISTPRAAGAAHSRRADEVRAGRAYLRQQLQATAAGLQLHPLSQAAQEFPEMQAHLQNLHLSLLGDQAQQRVVQMFCRVGYAATQAPTPRRDPSRLIRA